MNEPHVGRRALANKVGCTTSCGRGDGVSNALGCAVRDDSLSNGSEGQENDGGV